MRNSFVELSARDRAKSLLDVGTARELLGPFEGLISPYLLAQDIVPQSDDGVILMRGKMDGQEALVIATEGAFQGGGIGEISGAKIFGALGKVLEENKKGNVVIPIIIFDTGGVRLQEANYGLLSISEIQNMIVALRHYVPVIGVVPGRVGSFGGMSITAALASTLIATNFARIGLNGPEVVEQEAGVREFDSSDKMLIWDTIGVNQKAKTGLIDIVVEDDITAITNEVKAAIQNPPKNFRSRDIDFFLSLYNEIDPDSDLTPESYAEIYKNHESKIVSYGLTTAGDTAQTESRGYTWFSLLTGIDNPKSEFPTVLAADVEQEGELRRYLSVVPDKKNPYYRARKGEVGLREGMILAKYIWEAIEADAHNEKKRPIILVIDVPGQSFGYKEELLGIHLALAASVDAYASARQAGHPVIGLIVGNAISGAFLAHGLQSNRLIALANSAINVQAMSKASAVRVTLRTIEQIDKAAEKVPSIAYDIYSFQKLGALYDLLEGIDGDNPTADNVSYMLSKITQVIDTLNDDRDFRFRYTNPQAVEFGRVMTNKVLTKLDETWDE